MISIAALLLIAQAGAIAAQPVDAPVAPAPCSSPAHRSFDFWVGEWEVYPNLKDPAKAPLIARSRIERLYGGCAIRENWMPLKGADGGSLNALDPVSGRWHQFWIGGDGAKVEFEGGPVAGKMVLTGFWRGVNGPGQDGLIRMTYTALETNTVRQHGELSTDHGLTWSDNFDFIYRRAKPGP
jgi:hypothetical protein